MAVTPADLLSPVGPVEAALFRGEGDGSPGTPLEVRLQTYIDRANDKIYGVAFPQPDDAVLAWALHLTFEGAYILACARPAAENTMVAVLGSESRAKDQRDALKDLSEMYAGEYAELEMLVPTVATVQKDPQSRTTPVVYDW